jgi:hypothetical protein
MKRLAVDWFHHRRAWRPNDTRSPAAGPGPVAEAVNRPAGRARLFLVIVCLVCLATISCSGATGPQQAPSRGSSGAVDPALTGQRRGRGAPPAAATGAALPKAAPQVRVFERVKEPREAAFSMLVPQGWKMDGGIVRIDPAAAGGPAQSIEAKLDMAVKRDDAGTVMGRVLPDMRYIDARYMPAGQMGIFPPGSHYSGMLVAPFPGAAQFIARMAFPWAHPGARNVAVVSSKPAPALAGRLQQGLGALPLPAPPVCDGAAVVFVYDEGGVRFKEVWSAVLVNWGQIGAGMWENKETRFMRAPEGEFDAWVPTFAAIQASVQVNPAWLAGEIQGQAVRSRIAIDTQQEVQRIEREIAANRQQVNSEIQNAMYLTLTGQEDYRNPFTGEYETRPVELGKFRWVNDLGHEVYADRSDYSPNDDVNVYLKGYRRSEPRR